MKHVLSISLVVFVCIAVFTLTAEATAPRIDIGAGEEERLAISGYDLPPYVTVEGAEAAGLLVDLVWEALQNADPPVAFDVAPTKSLMKYTLIQDIGIAAVGKQGDFSEEELEYLVEVPCYEEGDLTLVVVFNLEHEQGEALSKQFQEALQKMKESGRYDEIVKMHQE